MEQAQVISVSKSVALEMVTALWTDPAEKNKPSNYTAGVSLYLLRRSRQSLLLLLVGDSLELSFFLETYEKRYRNVRFLRNYAEIFPNFPLIE